MGRFGKMAQSLVGDVRQNRGEVRSRFGASPEDGGRTANERQTMAHIFYWWLASVLALAVSYAICALWPEWPSTSPVTNLP